MRCPLITLFASDTGLINCGFILFVISLTAADKIYNLGIARRAQPLERLKKRRDAFQARMLLPRPAASHTEDPSSSSLRTSATTAQRSILGGSSTGPAFRGTTATQATTKAALPNNGATAFAVFKDGSSDSASGSTANALASQEGWTDFGTNASRKRENERPAVPWKGETLPVYRDVPAENAVGGTSRPVSLSSSMKFEVFRDEDAEIPASDLGISQNRENAGLSMAKSLRGPPEAELLRSDPFRHYTQGIVNLAEIPELPFAQPPSASTSSSSSRTAAIKSSSSKVSSSSSRAKSASQPSSSAGVSSTALAPGEKRKERVASPLHEIYPEGAHGPEYSFEELRAQKRHLRKLKTGQPGSACTWHEEQPWQVEARTLHTYWRVDGNGQVVLRDPHSGEALFNYLREEDEREQEAKLAMRRERKQAQEAEERARRAELDAEKERDERRRQQRENQEQEERAQRLQAERLERERAEDAARLEVERQEAARRQGELEDAERVKRRQEEESRLCREAGAEEARKRAEREEQQRQEEDKYRELEAAKRLAEERQEQARIAADAEAEAERIQNEEREMARDLFDSERSISPPPSESYRPPSPTINTKAALAEVNAMFGKTMRFDGGTQEDDYDSSATEHSGSSENDFDQNDNVNETDTPFVPSQAETDGSFWSIAQSQSQQPRPFSSQPFSQPFSTQQSMPIDSQSSSLGFPSVSDSGSTTEESDGESDVDVRRNSHLDVGHDQFQQSLSRSSSSSSSSISGDHHPSLQASLRSHTPAFTAFKEASENDENAGPSQRKDRSVFKPTRTPLGAKSASSAPSTSKPAFAGFCEDEENGVAERRSHEENDDVAGYGMGRRSAGNNRFANMMDIMTPITERTCEFGMQTATMTSVHAGEVQARMLTGDQSNAEDFFDQVIPEDLASSRGSNWDAGRRLEQIDEEGDYSSQLEASQGKSWIILSP